MSGSGNTSSLGEFELIRRYFTPAHLPQQIALGVGDDGAIFNLPPQHQLVVSVDTQLPAVHFPAQADPGLIASRALHCAASDLAAMGAEPLGFTLALTLPTADTAWLAAFSTGLLQAAERLRCPLVGGDTTRGALCISVQVLGGVPSGQALRRSGAAVGDRVWISGSLGDGAAALACLENQQTFSAAATAYLQQRFYAPDVDFELGAQLRRVASSAVDVSDGLLADLGHICAASGVGARLLVNKLPISPYWRDQVSTDCAQHWALRGGDDYRLCFTAAPAHDALLQARGDVFCIGDIVAGHAVEVVDAQGVPIAIAEHGFQHF